MRLLSVVLLSALAACVYGVVCPAQEDLPRGCYCYTKWMRDISFSCRSNGQNTPTIPDIVATIKEELPSRKTRIEYLYFDGFANQSALPSNVFEGLRVQELKIVNSGFERWADEVGGPAFVGLEDSLEELHIISSIFVEEEYNGQTEMPAPFSLGHLRQVKKVKIFKNRLYVFGKDWFGNGGSSVDELDIEQNEIHVIGEEALVGLTNMRNFKAERNSITELTRSMFPEDTKLWLLDVRKNKLEGFPEDFFVNFPSLKKIELNVNPIKYVPENVFGKIWEQLDYIDFKDTLLHCDEHIDWMLDVKEPYHLLGWCQTPAEVAGDRLSSVLYERKEAREGKDSDE